ncbi:MAG: DUF2931 family protein [Paludibacteraceae bacterium]|nr:DUF2931 family protein [Paludibacteraceae bacterium]
MKYSAFFLIPILCIFFTYCNMEKNSEKQNMYYWEPEVSTSKANPIENIDVSYFFEDGSKLCVFGSAFTNLGLSKWGCFNDYGKDWKINLPTEVGAKWISYAEKKAYIIYTELPIEQIKYNFENGYEGYTREGKPEKGMYKSINLCLLPKGEVGLYLKGSSRTILLDWSAKGEESQDYELFRSGKNSAKTLEEHISNTIKLNPELDIKEALSLDLIHKYFERFNYKIKVDFEDKKSIMKWHTCDFSNAEHTIAYNKDEEQSIKYPSRMKYFKNIWDCNGYQYTAYFYFNEDEMLRVFDEAYGDDRMQKGELNIFVSKYNNLFEISLNVGGESHVLKKTEIRVFRDPLSDLNGESELMYKNYENDHQNIFKGE